MESRLICVVNGIARCMGAAWPGKGIVVPRRPAFSALAVLARRRVGEVSLTGASATATPSGTHV